MITDEKYILALSNENTNIPYNVSNYENIKDDLEIVWSGKSLTTAKKKFYELIEKQAYEYREAKTLKVWRKIWLFDPYGHVIATES